MSELKSSLDVENLKAQWRDDPCWDIEETEGFEDYKADLLKYRREMEAGWEYANEQKRTMKMLTLQCSPEMLDYLEKQQSIIEKLSQQIDILEDKINRLGGM